MKSRVLSMWAVLKFKKKKIREMYEEAFNKFLREYESKSKENQS